MTKLNLMLFFVLILSSLGLVDAQHRARKLYNELEQVREAEKKYELEYGQLQLEQSTWAMHSRVEEIATSQLSMQVPDEKRVQVVMLGLPDAVLPDTALPDEIVSQANVATSAINNGSASAKPVKEQAR